MMVPLNFVDVLTAAAPIVASLASIANKNKPEVEGKQKTISVTINNNFYTNSVKEAEVVASNLHDDMIKTIATAGNRYVL